MGLSPEKFEKVRFLLEFVPEIFKQHQNILKFTKKHNFSMVDIGTGPGKMLFRIENSLPKNYKEIICTDRSTEMLEYFNSIPKDSRITSRMLDISDEKMPDDLKERFDFAFSSFCFAYALDLRRILRNCSYLLKKDGETFFIWPKQSHVYEVYRSLSKIDKWKPYTSDFKNWKSLSDNEDPIGILQTYIEDAGLETVKIVEYDDFVFEEPEDLMLDTYESQDKIMHRIPKIDQQKYREDFNRIVRSEQMVLEETSDGKKLKIPMNAVVVITRKT